MAVVGGRDLLDEQRGAFEREVVELAPKRVGRRRCTSRCRVRSGELLELALRAPHAADVAARGRAVHRGERSFDGVVVPLDLLPVRWLCWLGEGRLAAAPACATGERERAGDPDGTA